MADGTWVEGCSIFYLSGIGVSVMVGLYQMLNQDRREDRRISFLAFIVASPVWPMASLLYWSTWPRNVTTQTTATDNNEEPTQERDS